MNDVFSAEELITIPGVRNVVFVGSRVTCNPPPTDTDIDILVFASDAEKLSLMMAFRGFQAHLCASKVEDLSNSANQTVFDGTQSSPFVSLRRGEVNLIVTDQTRFFRRFLAATSVAKKLNLLSKPDRIDLFQAVLYGNSVRP
jgi:hypothetical protein